MVCRPGMTRIGSCQPGAARSLNIHERQVERSVMPAKLPPQAAAR